MKSLHCYEPSQTQTMLAPLLIHMQTLETFKQDSSQEVVPPPAPTKGGAATPFVSTVHIHGSLILQELLKFNKPIKVVNSLLAMEPASLRGLLSDPKGSHVTDVFMTSTTIGEKSREGLVKSLQVKIAIIYWAMS